MHLSLVPGLGFEGGEDGHKHFGMHAEFLYEFAIKQFHLGPVLEVAYEKDNSHIGMGIHFGFGF